MKVKILKKFFVTDIIVPAERTRLLRELGMSIDNLWRNSNERMSKRTMKSIIAYLLAFTMMATIATQAFLPAVAAADAQNSVSVVQVETGSEEETGEPASQQPDETDPETVVTEEATSQESTSEEAAPEEVVTEESTSGEVSSEVSTSEEASSEKLISDENASSEAASSEAASEEASSSEAASQEEAELLDEELLAEEEEQETLDEVEEPTEVVPNGGVNAVISAAMALNRDVSFTMTLYRNGENVAQTSGTLKQNGEGGASQVKLSGTGLEADSYEVVISAPGFASYSQSLEVSQNMYSELTLYTGELSGYGSAAHPGVLRVGDADGDGVLSETDADTIVNAIQHGVYSHQLGVRVLVTVIHRVIPFPHIRLPSINPFNVHKEPMIDIGQRVIVNYALVSQRMDQVIFIIIRFVHVGQQHFAIIRRCRRDYFIL